MILPRTPSLSAPFPTNLSNRLCFDISPSPNLLHVSQNESFTSLLYTSDYEHFLSFYPPGELEKWLAADKRLPQSSSILSEVSVAVQTAAAWLSQLAPSCYVVFKAEKVVVLDMAEGKGSDGTYSGLASLTSRAAASSCVRA